MDELLIQGHVLLAPRRAPIPGWLRIDGDRIERVAEGDPPRPPDAGGPSTVISPGFIDAHIHLPQIDSIGFDGMPLMDWLEQIIYPAEAAWENASLARAQMIRAQQAMLRAGTLGYAAYLTSHEHAIEGFASLQTPQSQRSVAGQVLMDRDSDPRLLGHTIRRPLPTDVPRHTTSINPRFGVSCSDDLLQQAGEIARGDDRCFIQTHLAETKTECARVRELFPDDEHYTAVYDRHGLLTNRTLLAHCLHLSDSEWSMIATRGSVIVHCPTANTFLRAGLFDLRAAHEHNIRLALGSDVAAGPDIDMPRVARAMIDVAKLRKRTLDDQTYVPAPAEAWDLITRGNADALGWPDAGRIQPGAQADLLLIHAPFEPDAHLLERLIYGWRDDFITDRVVAGRLLPTGRSDTPSIHL